MTYAHWMCIIKEEQSKVILINSNVKLLFNLHFPLEKFSLIDPKFCSFWGMINELDIIFLIRDRDQGEPFPFSPDKRLYSKLFLFIQGKCLTSEAAFLVKTSFFDNDFI